MGRDVTIVIMTRDRIDELRRTLRRHIELHDPPRIIVVDNGSGDGTPAAIRREHPGVEVVEMGHNAGVGARNRGVELATTAYVAFADDDSWWAPGALEQVVAAFERHPELGALTASVVVEPMGTDDPLTEVMAASPVEGDPGLPGVPVLGFLACATAVRREAFLAVGGFNERLHFGGEEQLLATDLAAAGWAIRYLDEVQVHHEPSTRRATGWRRRRDLRNTLWFLWLRRPAGSALRRSVRLLGHADVRTAVAGFASALLGVPWVVRQRQVVPSDVERQLRRLERI
jgi:GT2 family glycosyltransferase